uniref:RING-type domain-containing protein n=1 Tax=Odontella aurita TaxID=265563 RepID=A0A7S4MF59_9STRA
METVTLSRLPAAAGGAASRGNAEAGKSDSTNASGAGREWDPGQSDGKGTAALGECCICMSEFRVAEVFQAGDAEGEDGSAEDAHEVDALLSVSHLVDNEVKDAAHNANDHHKSDNGVIVRTKCGHLFHRECLGGWIGGRWMDEAGGEGDENRRRRRRRKARRRCCPLCREDMAPVGSVNVNEDGD